MMGIGYSKCFPVTECLTSDPAVIGFVPWTELQNTCLKRHLFYHQGHLHALKNDATMLMPLLSLKTYMLFIPSRRRNA